MYFLQKDTQLNNEIDENSTIPETILERYIKLKNYKWVFHGISKTFSRYKNKSKTRKAYLLNPLNSSSIVAAIRHLIPLNLRNVHAFEDKIIEIIRLKLKIALLSTPSNPTLKEKLFKRQEGLCYLCHKMINYEYLHLNTAHIHHIKAIKAGGDKFAIKNLALTHSWCHYEYKH